MQKIKNPTHSPENNGISEGGQGKNTHASAWNVLAYFASTILLAFKRAFIAVQGQATVLLEGFGAWDTIH